MLAKFAGGSVAITRFSAQYETARMGFRPAPTMWSAMKFLGRPSNPSRPSE